MIEHNLWFNNITNLASKKEAADKSGIPVLELYDQLDDGILPEKTVIALARAYDLSPVEALLHTGYLSEEETASITKDTTPDSADDYPTWALNSHLDHSILEAFGDIAEEVNSGRVSPDNATEQINAWLDELPGSLFSNLRSTKAGYLELFETYLD